MIIRNLNGYNRSREYDNEKNKNSSDSKAVLVS